MAAIISTEYGTRIYTHLTRIEGDEPDFEAWTDGGTWNGWQRPLFEKAVADAVIQFVNRWNPQPQGDAYFDADQDAYFTPDENDAEHFNIWRGMDWCGKRVYPVGARSWTWDVDE
jgi:hypothetical protein